LGRRFSGDFRKGWQGRANNYTAIFDIDPETLQMTPTGEKTTIVDVAELGAVETGQARTIVKLRSLSATLRL